MRILFKIFKWIGIILLVLILGGVIFGMIRNEKLPEGTPSATADVLAEKMMEAVNKKAWDTTHVVSWTFADRHDFLWDKKRHLVRVNWGNNEVFINPNEMTGKAFQNGKEVTGNKGYKLVRKALRNFWNDSFWLNAPLKAFAPGTERSMVNVKDGREGLMVSYKSGGVTPGDSYVWFLDENNLPTEWKMWVKIVPIGGVGTTWEDWITLDTGAKIATSHRNGRLNVPAMTNVKGSISLEAHGITDDPFAIIAQ